jgi:Domain of unknown function (DUF4274)
MTEEERQKLLRQWMYNYLSRQNPETWYWYARSWNWNNGTWLLNWIVQQENCNRATAQLIFWLGDPEQFLPLKERQNALTLVMLGHNTALNTAPYGPEDWNKSIEGNREVYELLSLILHNWKNGKYGSRSIYFFGFLKVLTGDLKAFLSKSRRETIEWHDVTNPISSLSTYRGQEKLSELNFLPWKVPNDLGWPTSARFSDSISLNLNEGFPPEYFEFANSLEKQDTLT